MALQIIKFSTGWRDIRGWTARVSTFILADDTSPTIIADVDSAATALVSAIAGISNAVLSYQDPVLYVTQPDLAYGASGTYQTAWQKVVMVFRTADGTTSRYKIPAPKLSIFEQDGVTVENDGTNAAVVAFVNAIKNPHGTAQFCGKNGLVFDHFLGGTYAAVRKPRRMSITLKSADLEQGEP